LRKKRSTQLLRECWSLLKKLMTCQNLQNKLLNITVLFIWYLLASVKKMSLAKHGELYFILASTCFKFQSTRHFGECLKKMVSHTVYPPTPQVRPHRKFVHHFCLRFEHMRKSSDVSWQHPGVLFLVQDNVNCHSQNMRFKQVKHYQK
jgi:hypothetical protein